MIFDRRKTREVCSMTISQVPWILLKDTFGGGAGASRAGVLVRREGLEVWAVEVPEMGRVEYLRYLNIGIYRYLNI